MTNETQRTSKRLLIVDDTERELQHAKECAYETGFCKNDGSDQILVARTLEEALSIFDEKQPTHVLTDLFFPVGGSVEKYVGKVLPIYEKFENSPGGLKSKGWERRAKYEPSKKAMLNGEQFPSGLIISERAVTQNKPCMIVTSAYHHDMAFEAISGGMGARYVDWQLDPTGKNVKYEVDENNNPVLYANAFKAWRKAYEMLKDGTWDRKEYLRRSGFS